MRGKRGSIGEYTTFLDTYVTILYLLSKWFIYLTANQEDEHLDESWGRTKCGH